MGVLKTTPLGSDLDDLDMVEVDHGVNQSYIYTYFTYYDPMVEVDHGVITYYTLLTIHSYT
jgi:hypothetical protein